MSPWSCIHFDGKTQNGIPTGVTHTHTHTWTYLNTQSTRIKPHAQHMCETTTICRFIICTWITYSHISPKSIPTSHQSLFYANTEVPICSSLFWPTEYNERLPWYFIRKCLSYAICTYLHDIYIYIYIYIYFFFNSSLSHVFIVLLFCI